jgi:ankyrin repeat protein
MPLLELPNEILLCIVEDHLPDSSDVFSLLLTCRRFANLLPGSLDRLAVTGRYVKWAVCFAAAHQNEDMVRMLIQKGERFHVIHLMGKGRRKSVRFARHPAKPYDLLVRHIMELGANLAIRNCYMGEWGRGSCRWATSLHAAVWKHHVGMVKTLLSKGANTEELDADGLTALQLATSLGKVDPERLNEIVKLLFKHGAKVVARRPKGLAPVTQAVVFGNAYQVELMCSKVIDSRFRAPGLTGRWGLLNLAANYGFVDVAKVLIRKGADLNMCNMGTEMTPLYHAIQGGYLELAKLLIDKGALINKAGTHGETPLQHAIHCKKREMVDLLLDRGASINLADSRGWTALHTLVKEHPNPSLIKLLVERGADTTTQDNCGSTPLHTAIRRGIAANIKAILDLTPQKCLFMTSHEGHTPLHVASLLPETSIVKLLLYRDPDISFVDCDGTPALHLAVQWKDANLVEQILTRHKPQHPSINAQDSQKQTALHHAARRGYKTITSLLVTHGIDISIQDSLGQTALHHAARFSAVTTEVLLCAGARVKARDENGRTPLHYAARHAKSAAYLLIEHGADVTAKDGYGRPVPDWLLNEYYYRMMKNGKEGLCCGF